jgi:uncharacterized membrane protein (UPF0127 family)
VTLVKKIKNGFFLNHVRHARTMGQRFKGLMGVSPEKFDYALVFHLPFKGKMNASIHMMFMKVPIDIVYLDENKKVVDLVENIKPWTWNYTPEEPAKFFVEIPAGTVKDFQIKKGTLVSW